jgi:hypothetical protein
MNPDLSTREEPKNTGPGESRMWETPTIEEVDFASTEAGYSGTGPDLGLYHS